MILSWKYIQKNYPQVYPEQCKYKEKKRRKPVAFIHAELDLDSNDSDGLVESK